MSAKTNLGSTSAQHRAMLGHLITIGTAMDRESWGDNLQRINGIGPKYESILHEQGITTFAQLVEMDEQAKARLDRALDEFPLANLDRWVESAKVLAGDTPQQADDYLETINQHRGRPIDKEGVAETIVRTEEGHAELRRFNAFDPPTAHPPVRHFVTALRAFVAATDGTARIPDLDPHHLWVLRSTYDSLTGDDT